MSLYITSYERPMPVGRSGLTPKKTRCKHGDKPCDLCGTSDGVDMLHTTIAGSGTVGRLLKKSRRAK